MGGDWACQGIPEKGIRHREDTMLLVASEPARDRHAGLAEPLHGKVGVGNRARTGGQNRGGGVALLHLKQEAYGGGAASLRPKRMVGGDDALAHGRAFRRGRMQGPDEDGTAEFEHGQKIVIEHHENLQTEFLLKRSHDDPDVQVPDGPESNSCRFRQKLISVIISEKNIDTFFYICYNFLIDFQTLRIRNLFPCTACQL